MFRRVHLIELDGEPPVRAPRLQPSVAGPFPCDPDVPAERPIEDFSREETRDAMYEAVAEVRLELIYCPHLNGDLRKRWANELGSINLAAPTAACEVQRLRNELAGYEANWHDQLHLEVAQIRHGLWRLRELCLRHQAFDRAVAK